MIALLKSRHVGRLALWLMVALVILWGLRLNLLEGFIYEWPRHFRGDFHQAMFGAWDGRGIFYGPVFVMERWLVNASPRVFNEYFFALLNLPLVALAFVFVSRAARLSAFTTVLSGALWLCFQWLPYAFSVSANPEILELALLSSAWYVAARHSTPVGAAAVVAAALIKRIPAIFLPIVLMTDGIKRSVVIGSVAVIAILVIVGIGQGMTPIEVAWRTMVPPSPSSPLIGPANGTEWTTLSSAVLAQPFPYPSQFVGLNNALPRLFARPVNDWSLPFFQGYYYVVLLSALAFAIFVAHGLLRRQQHLARGRALTLVYGIFFGMMPLAAVTTHPHTFIFLLPTFSAVIALVATEPHARFRRWLALLAAVSYLFIGFPAVVTPIDRLVHVRLSDAGLFQDPIWLNLALLIGLFAYATALLHRPKEGVGQDPRLEGRQAPAVRAGG